MTRPETGGAGAFRHFLDLGDAGGDDIAAMLNDAIDRKAARAGLPKGAPDADAPLKGRVLNTPTGARLVASGAALKAWL